MPDDAAPTAPWSTQDPTWLASAARIADGTTDPIGVDRFTAIWLYFAIATPVGTNPTINFFLQTLMPDAVTWVDIAALTQVTGAAVANKVLGFMSGGNAEYTATDGTMVAGTIKTVPLGRKIRVKWVLGGTATPGFTFSIQRMLFE